MSKSKARPAKAPYTLQVILRDVEGAVRYDAPCTEETLDRVMRQVLSYREELRLDVGWYIQTEPIR